MPDAPPPRPTPPWRRRIIAGAAENIGLKAAALFFALVLWLIVSAKEPSQELVQVRFAPTFDSTLHVEGPLPSIHALVVGPGQELLKLYASPPVVHHNFPADVPDVVTFHLGPGDVDLPPGLDARVQDVEPRTVTMRFDPTLEKDVPVRSALRLQADSGIRIAGPPSLDPDTVTVVGRRLAVSKIDSITTLKQDLMVHDSSPLIVELDTANLGVRVRPARVRVSIKVEPDTVHALTTPDVPAPLPAGTTATTPARGARTTASTHRRRRGPP